MRVAHVITRLIIGGAQENTVYNCADLVRDYNDDVLLITGPSLGPEGSLLDRARASHLDIAEAPALRRAIHPVRDALAYRQIKQALNQFQPEVVHTHSAKAGLLGRIAARSINTPVIVHTVHGAPWHDFQNPLSRQFFKRCERFAAGYCDHFICVADAMRDLMIAAQVAPRERFTTIYSGMEVEPFLQAHHNRERVRRELGFLPQHIVFGKIARLFHLKGHDDLIAAATRVVRANPDVRFLLVGDGILFEHLQRSIRSRGLESYFTFTGLVAPQRIPELISAMDALVHVSLREGLARALPQALLAGLPVISYDIDGAREVVIPDQTGFLLPPRDIKNLANAIIELAADPQLRFRFGQTGQARFADVFRHENMTRDIRAIYSRLLSEKSAALSPALG